MNKLKKGIKYILLAILLLIASISKISPVFAQDVVITKQPSGVIKRGYYYAVNSNGDKITHGDGYNVNILKVNGIPAFCIEPDIFVGTGAGKS